MGTTPGWRTASAPSPRTSTTRWPWSPAPARPASHLGVHFLATDARALAELFGSETGDAVDKFRSCRWHPGPEEVPVLDDCARWVVGDVLPRRATGDHTGFLLAPVAARCEPWRGQLGFQATRDIRPGHPA